MHSTTPEELGHAIAAQNKSYAQSDAVRYPKGKSPEAFTFLVTQAALELWPSDVKLTDLDIALINGEARDTALTIRLNELANF